MKEDALVSVIIATFNTSITLRCSLESLANQQYTHFEAWIIGDGCTDDTEAVVKSFGDKRFNYFNLSENHGAPSVPNNEGLKRAKGKYIAYLGHDDLWFPWHLTSMVEEIEKSNSDFVHALVAFIHPQGVDGAIGQPSNGRTYANHMVSPTSWMHTNEILASCGYWKDISKLSLNADMVFLNTIAKAGKKISYVPQLIVLKFPSASWKLYSLKEGHPQVLYLDMMEPIYSVGESLSALIKSIVYPLIQFMEGKLFH